MKYLFLVIAFLSCKSGAEKVTDRHMESDTGPQLSARHDTSTTDQPDPYQAGTDADLVNEAMDKIFKFPEVQAVNKQISKKSKGSHGIAILVRDELMAILPITILKLEITLMRTGT